MDDEGETLDCDLRELVLTGCDGNRSKVADFLDMVHEGDLVSVRYRHSKKRRGEEEGHGRLDGKYIFRDGKPVGFSLRNRGRITVYFYSDLISFSESSQH